MAASAKEFLLSLRNVDQVISQGLANAGSGDSSVVPFHCSLAPIFGHLTKGSVKQLDDNLKVIISGATDALANLVHGAQPSDIDKLLSWDNVTSLFNQTPMLELMPGSTIARSDNLVKDNMNYFRFDGSPDNAVVREVHSWFVNFIRDQDVLSDTKIDIDVLGKVVAQTGATITDFVSFWSKHEHHEQTVLDMGLLRYPDISHPYFKLYRIKLRAWSDSDRVLFVQHDANGITGEFNLQCYKPRDAVIASMTRESLRAGVEEAEDLFD